MRGGSDAAHASARTTARWFCMEPLSHGQLSRYYLKMYRAVLSLRALGFIRVLPAQDLQRAGGALPLRFFITLKPLKYWKCSISWPACSLRWGETGQLSLVDGQDCVVLCDESVSPAEGCCPVRDSLCLTWYCIDANAAENPGVQLGAPQLASLSSLVPPGEEVAVLKVLFRMVLRILVCTGLQTPLGRSRGSSLLSQNHRITDW